MGVEAGTRNGKHAHGARNGKAAGASLAPLGGLADAPLGDLAGEGDSTSTLGAPPACETRGVALDALSGIVRARDVGASQRHASHANAHAPLPTSASALATLDGEIGEPDPSAPAAGEAGVLPDTLRIYIAGAHSTGKTTLARWIARAYRLPLVTEVARSVLAELEVPLETLRVDLDRTRAFQAEVFKRQAEMEHAAGRRFVSDRTFDNLAYACHHTIGVREIAGDLEAYARRLRARGSLVFFTRPHRDLLANDGVRASVDWEEIVRIDGMVKLLLELHDVDYITIDTLNMAERARAVRGVLAAMGIRAPRT